MLQARREKALNGFPRIETAIDQALRQQLRQAEFLGEFAREQRLGRRHRPTIFHRGSFPGTAADRAAVGRARHAAGAAQEVPLGGELRRQVGQLRAAGAGAGRIAALRHESLDHPMERRVVIEPLARQRLDLRDGFRRQVGEHLDHHPAVFQIHVQRIFRIERRLGAAAAAPAAARPAAASETPVNSKVRRSMEELRESDEEGGWFSRGCAAARVAA